MAIRSCTCKNDFQDRRYGKGLRVFNRTLQQRPDSERGWRCTSCGTVVR
jgi:hypothetical protein